MKIIFSNGDKKYELKLVETDNKGNIWNEKQMNKTEEHHKQDWYGQIGCIKKSGMSSAVIRL